MTSSALRRRTYGLPPSGRVPSPSLDTPFTPTEELSSWLPDEVCVACGAQVKASQLYCSDACRQKEGDHPHRRQEGAFSGHPPGSSLTPASAPPNAKVGSTTRHYFLNPTAADIDSLQRFRYPCPPSPLLIAQRKTTVADRSSPTSLISAAFNKGSDVKDSPQHYDARRTSSAGAYSDHRPQFGRRNSADSSGSSLASSSAFLTDPSTPSPGMANRGCGSSYSSQDNDAVDDEELNSSNFCLPPSLAPPTALVLNASQSVAYHHRSRSDRQVSPAQLHPRRPQTSTGEDHGTVTATMSFARKPGSTNVPAPVLYSPVLAARTSASTIADILRRRSHKARLDVRERVPLDQIDADQSSAAEGPSACTGASHFGANPKVTTHGRSSSHTTKRMQLQRASSDPSQLQLYVDGETSPQQHDSGGSGSSSAARTMRAFSPSSLASSGEFCGRPGCSGTSFFRGNPFPFGDRSNEPSQQEKTTGCSLAESGSLTGFDEAHSPRSLPRHKHTHSARANLSVHDHLGAAALTSLAMTPVQPRLRVCDVLSTEEKAQHASAPVQIDDSQAHANPRGRSKARGRRSTSRRSRSPPRAAARGRSVALQNEERKRKVVNPDSPPLEAVRPRSDPIDIDPPTRRMSGNQLSSGVVTPDDTSVTTAAATDNEEDREEPRRGRSPFGRSRRFSTIQSSWKSPNTKGDPVLTEAHGRKSATTREGQLYKGNASAEQNRPHIEQGFDDIENLELEA